MHLHPKRFTEGRWTFARCDCDEQAPPEGARALELASNVEFPVTEGFGCYTVVERDGVVVACTEAKLSLREFSANEAIARMEKVTAKQSADLRKMAIDDWLAPGSARESSFFAAIDKIAGTRELESRRKHLMRATQSQLEVMLYLCTLGFGKRGIVASYYASKARAKTSREATGGEACVWDARASVARIRRQMEALIRRDAVAFLNEDTRERRLRSLGPVDPTALTLGSARAIVQGVRIPLARISPGFAVGPLQKAFIGDVPGAPELRDGSFGIVGPCREAGGEYISLALARCYATLERLVADGYARVTDDLEAGNAGRAVRDAKGSFTLRHVNIVDAADLIVELERMRVEPLVALTLTAPFDFDEDLNTQSWRVLRGLFTSARPQLPEKPMSAVAPRSEGARFALVPTCADARARAASNTWAFFPAEMTIARRRGDGTHERLLSNKAIAPDDTVYACGEENGEVFVPACCAASLPDRCIPISRAILPREGRAARAIKCLAKRVSSTAVIFEKIALHGHRITSGT